MRFHGSRKHSESIKQVEMPRADDPKEKAQITVDHLWNSAESTSEKRPSLVRKPLIAFAPEHEGIPLEILELEEHLEYENDVTNRDEKVKRESLSEESKEIHPLTPAHPITISGDKWGETGPVYDHLPRPYVQHWKEIEMRRAKKMMDIMNGTREEFVFSEKDKRVKIAPSGTLIFHVLELFHIAVNTTTFIKSLPVSFYCVLNMGSLKRCSKIFHSKTSRRIRVDYTANFSLEISEWAASPMNNFNLELWSYQDPEIHYIVGNLEIHAYQFIRKQHAVELKQLLSDGIKVGKVAFEYAFAYGSFGYGHSNHLKNPNNPIMETVCHSMYPRIRLGGKDIIDKVYRIRMSNELKLFTFNSLILEVDLPPEELDNKKTPLQNPVVEPKPVIVQQVEFREDKPIHCKLHMNIYQSEIQADFNDAYGEFVCLGVRRNRLDYLTNLVSGRMRDIRETEAGWLFHQFKDKEAERVSKTEVRPGHFVFPQRIPCPSDIIPVKLTPEEEEFQEGFPATRRQNGYLATLFGFSPKAKKADFLNDMDFPLYKEAIKVKGRVTARKWLMALWLLILAYFNMLYHFIFPEVDKEVVVPEISVTTPSPEGSTTNVYTYFIRDHRDTGVDVVHKLQAQTAALIDFAERPYLGPDEDDSDTSSSSDGEGGGGEVRPKGKSLTADPNNDKVNGGQKGEIRKIGPYYFKAGLNQPIIQ